MRLSWAGKRESARPDGARLKAEKPAEQGFELVSGDNLRALHALAERPQRFALAYLDPPFLTGREHAEVGRRRNAEGDIVRTLTPAFDDRWDSLEAYLTALGDRLSAARALLRRGRLFDFARRPEDEPLREGHVRRDLRTARVRE